jgi:diaminopimelate decarboxylase
MSQSNSFAPEVFSRHARFDGELTLAGVCVNDLVAEFGTPLYVLDEADLRSRASEFSTALRQSFGEQAGRVYYASKALLNKEVARWIKSEGLGIDVCSGGELAVAVAVDFPGERIQFHGNNKSIAELAAGIKAGVGSIVIDSFDEIARANQLAGEAGVIANVLLRITAGIEAHTHEFIATAHEDVKFGFSLASGAAWKATQAVEQANHLRLVGYHSHIGSQIFAPEGFEIAAARLISLLAKFRDAHNRELPELDLGGGYGVAYLPGESTLDPFQIIEAIAAAVRKEIAAHNLAMPKISIEPGRAIAAPCGTMLYEVGTIKHVELDGGATRRYVAVDGGMSDNIRPALYGAEYHAIVANREVAGASESTRIVGKHCESGDILIRDINLSSDLAPGDLIAIPATGAYGRSMASNYNHLPRPAVVAVRDGHARLIVRREQISDLLALDL